MISLVHVHIQMHKYCTFSFSCFSHLLIFFVESIEQMVVNMRATNEISPTLKEIIFQFDKDNQRPSQTFNVGQQSDATADAYDANEVDFDSNLFGNNDAWTSDHEAETSSFNQSSSFGDPSFQSHEVFATSCVWEVTYNIFFSFRVSLYSHGSGGECRDFSLNRAAHNYEFGGGAALILLDSLTK